MNDFSNLKLDKQLCFALYTATNSITRMYRTMLSELDLTYPQYLVLLVLWESDGLSIKQVGNQLKMDIGTLSPIIQRLEKSGFLLKKRIDTDERIVRLFLTEQSKKFNPLSLKSNIRWPVIQGWPLMIFLNFSTDLINLPKAYP